MTSCIQVFFINFHDCRGTDETNYFFISHHLWFPIDHEWWAAVSAVVTIDISSCFLVRTPINPCYSLCVGPTLKRYFLFFNSKRVYSLMLYVVLHDVFFLVILSYSLSQLRNIYQSSNHCKRVRASVFAIMNPLRFHGLISKIFIGMNWCSLTDTLT